MSPAGALERRDGAGGFPAAEGEPRAGLAAWAVYDWASNAFATVVVTFVFSAYLMNQVAPDPATGSAWWGTTVGVASATAALAGPVLGAVVDQTGRRKPWIGVLTLIACVATAGLAFVAPGPAWAGLGLALVFVAIVAAETASVAYNSMLPDLAGPDRVGRWSGWAWSLGYLGGVACLLLALFGLIREDAWIDLPDEGALGVRAAFVLAATWFLLFSLPLLVVTPDRPRVEVSAGQALRRGLTQLGRTLRHVRRYGGLVRFLVARLIYIDGLATVFVFGGAYAAGTFDMTEAEVVAFGVGLSVAAGVGAAAFAWVDDWVGARKTILVALVGLILPGLALVLVRSTTLLWVFGLVLGIFVGPVQSASRSYLARAAPEELRGEMFGLYAFSGKVSFLGPLLVGWLSYLTGSQRWGLSAVLLLLAVGFVVMLTVPTPEEAGRPLRVR